MDHTERLKFHADRLGAVSSARPQQRKRVARTEALREWLSSEQRSQYDAHRYFEVIGSHTGKRYRIRHGTSTNIYELDEQGRPKVGWCFVPRDDLVAGDVMLAQKIALETDEL